MRECEMDSRATDLVTGGCKTIPVHFREDSCEIPTLRLVATILSLWCVDASLTGSVWSVDSYLAGPPILTPCHSAVSHTLLFPSHST